MRGPKGTTKRAGRIMEVTIKTPSFIQAQEHTGWEQDIIMHAYVVATYPLIVVLVVRFDFLEKRYTNLCY